MIDEQWVGEFRERIESCKGLGSSPDAMLVSVKVRVSSGCFHREHSPQAYSQIDKYLKDHPGLQKETRFIEHESGPELIVYLTVAGTALAFSAGVINFITAIINARTAGKKKGDTPAAPLDLIVRGFREDGVYVQETIAHIEDMSKVSSEAVNKLLDKAFKPLPKPKPQVAPKAKSKPKKKKPSN